MTKLDVMRKGVKVRRVVRRFELWPVAKVAFFFHLLCYLLTLGVLTGVWFVAGRMGTIKNLERLITRLGWDEFEAHGDVLFRAAAAIGASLVFVATIATVTLAFFYNMLSGIFGGLVLSVLQEHTDGSSMTRRKRRKAARRAYRAKQKAAKQLQKNFAKTPKKTKPQRPTELAKPVGPQALLRPSVSAASTPGTVSYLDDSHLDGDDSHLDDDDSDLDDDATWTDHLRPRDPDAISASGLPGTPS